jgi:hypothetical protein
MTKSREIARVCSMHGEEDERANIFGGKTRRIEWLGRPIHRWEDNIELDLGEIRWRNMDWIHLAQDWYQWRTLVNTVMNLWV